MITQMMEYTGPIIPLQGKTAMVRPINSAFLRYYSQIDKKHFEGCVLAQFDEPITFNSKRMDYDWHTFPLTHFTPLGTKPIF